MAEVLATFPEKVTGSNGVTYKAQACGSAGADGLWSGWIEFVPDDRRGAPVRSARETTQPNRMDTIYWASGLSAVYLEGALERALNPLVVRVPPPPGTSVFDGPAAEVQTRRGPGPANPAILDPRSVYRKGERLLRQELGALSVWHLVNIITAYHLSSEPASRLNQRPAPELVELIVNGMRREVTTGK